MSVRPDHADRIRPRLPIRWLGLGFLLLAGCGLADYEAKMAESQNRLQRFQEENKVLDEPLKMPNRLKDGEVVSAGNVFLRPPKGIKEVAEATPREEVFFTYLPRAGTAAGPFSRIEIAFGPEQQDKDFSEVVFGHFQGRGEMTRTRREVQSMGRRVVFDSGDVKMGQAGHISINMPRGCSRSVALIYYILPNQNPLAQPIIKTSLETFGCDADVAKQREADEKNLKRWGRLH
jgi:hypothetical protein